MRPIVSVITIIAALNGYDEIAAALGG